MKKKKKKKIKRQPVTSAAMKLTALEAEGPAAAVKEMKKLIKESQNEKA